jgi:hypothetical protein
MERTDKTEKIVAELIDVLDRHFPRAHEDSQQASDRCIAVSSLTVALFLAQRFKNGQRGRMDLFDAFQQMVRRALVESARMGDAVD